MAILKKNAFSRRVPDLVTEELVAVFSRRASFEFKQLFDIVHENLRARNAASGGEEMLRLRAYEKLQNLVARGAVKKTGKKYKGLAVGPGQQRSRRKTDTFRLPRRRPPAPGQQPSPERRPLLNNRPVSPGQPVPEEHDPRLSARPPPHHRSDRVCRLRFARQRSSGKGRPADAVKDTAYECGMIPQGEAQPRFSVKFYLVAMLFILFDLEIVFMYPWAVVYREMIVESQTHPLEHAELRLASSWSDTFTP